MAQLLPQFTSRGVRVCALSCNDTASHEEWAKDIMAVARLQSDRGFPYPIIADPDRVVAKKFGMLEIDDQSAGLPVTCRAVFVFGPDKTLKLSLLYPASTGAPRARMGGRRSGDSPGERPGQDATLASCCAPSTPCS